MEPILKVDGLKKYFPVEKTFLERLLSKTRRFVKAVDGISFQVCEGEVFTLVGESGCGKTTTGRLILRLIEPTSGKIYFRDTDLTALKGEALRKLRREIQTIFQDPYASLNPRMKIGDAVAHPLKIHNIGNGGETLKRTLEALKIVGLTPPEKFYKLYPHELSGGQRQRVAVARAIITNPSLIVADEPVSMIDVSLRASILELLLDLRNRFKLTYLFITHDLAVAKYISDRIAIMYLGKIVETGKKLEVFSEPLHPYTKALLSAIPVPNPKAKRKEVSIRGEVPSAIDIPAGCRFNTRCPLASSKCLEVEPELRSVKNSHMVACHIV